MIFPSYKNPYKPWCYHCGGDARPIDGGFLKCRDCGSVWREISKRVKMSRIHECGGIKRFFSERWKCWIPGAKCRMCLRFNISKPGVKSCL